MKILVTGSKGFIGKNLIAELSNRENHELFAYDTDTDATLLEEYCRNAEFVFHLAGVNRPRNSSEYMEGNFGFTSVLLELLERNHNACPVMVSSSVQAVLDNPYGKSKKAEEALAVDYGRKNGSKILVYRFPNVFGKWCRPNYNSAVATFCHNIAHQLPITVNDSDTMLGLVYIDDVIEELCRAIEGKENRCGDFCEVPTVYTEKLGVIAELLYSFERSRKERSIPNMADPFTKKLYSTYLSYLPRDQFGYELKMNVDHRGSFTEFLRTADRGQVSVNVSKPQVTKGNHWHHSKNEKFLVVSGRGVIRFREVNSEEVIEYYVDASKLEVIDVPSGYIHSIENLGDTDLVTLMWANESYDPARPDTYPLEV